LVGHLTLAPTEHLGLTNNRYHSHFSSQYGNGVVGTIQIDGPASLNYDEDLGVFPITDWYYGAADEIQHSLIPPPGAAPPSDNILFNGTHGKFSDTAAT
jgi:FtsP/CotA-like multicopper oxidase with cupredoxin domain